MKSPTMEMLRAYLLAASLSAAFIDAAVLVSLIVFRVPAGIFESAAFRLGAAAVIVGTLIVIRTLADLAFHFALANQYVTVSGAQRRTVSLSQHCPKRLLVIFHVRLNRRIFDLGAT